MKGLLSDSKALVGLGLLASFLLMALVGPALVGDPQEPVGRPLEPPSAAHWLGTTGQGQDVLAQTIAGARPVLLLGFGVGLCVVAIGALVGIAAGTIGGRAGAVLDLGINLFLVIPGLPLMVVMAAYLPAGPTTLALALSATGWAWSARVFRAQAQALRGSDFVAAAIVAGEGPLRIIACEILPNMTSLLVSSFIGAVVYAVGALVGLEFLGLGDLGRVSWGSSLYWARNDAALLTGSWWTFVPAGACVGLLGFALGLVSSALDQVANPRLRVARAFTRAVGAGAAEGSTPVMRSGHG